MKDKILVDTSVWIDFFRNQNTAISSSLKELLRQEKTAVTGIIVTELYRGAKGKKELSFLESFLEVIHHIKMDEEIYHKAGRMGYRLSRQGIHIGTVDLVIAQTALEHGTTLYSLDSHFTKIAAHFPLALFSHFEK